MTNPIAKASLVEARKLIKEAVKSLESINIKSPHSTADPKYPPYNSNKLRNEVEKEANSRNKQKNRIDQSPSFTHVASGMNSQDMLAGQEKIYPYFISNKYPLPRSGYESLNGNVVPKTVTISPAAPLHTLEKSQRTKKTWIKGRLVEVTEGS